MSNTFLHAGLHQLVLEAFGRGSYLDPTLELDVTGPGGVGVTFAHDPAGPCNADCKVCNSDGLAYCEICHGRGPYGGVCISSLVA